MMIILSRAGDMSFNIVRDYNSYIYYRLFEATRDSKRLLDTTVNYQKLSETLKYYCRLLGTIIDHCKL